MPRHKHHDPHRSLHDRRVRKVPQPTDGRGVSEDQIADEMARMMGSRYVDDSEIDLNEMEESEEDE